MSLERPVVLIAEDDPSIRLTLQFVLEHEGFEIVFAEDGDKALETAKSRLPDAILLDHVMPKKDGKEVLEELRREPSTRDIPVLVLSGMTPRSGEEWPGAIFVAKPFAPDDLIDRLKEALGGPE